MQLDICMCMCVYHSHVHVQRIRFIYKHNVIIMLFFQVVCIQRKQTIFDISSLVILFLPRLLNTHYVHCMHMCMHVHVTLPLRVHACKQPIKTDAVCTKNKSTTTERSGHPPVLLCKAFFGCFNQVFGLVDSKNK